MHALPLVMLRVFALITSGRLIERLVRSSAQWLPWEFSHYADGWVYAGDWELAQTSRVVIAAGAMVGLAVGSMASIFAGLAPWIFTSDAALYPIMRGLAPQVFVSMALCGVDVRRVHSRTPFPIPIPTKPGK